MFPATLKLSRPKFPPPILQDPLLREAEGSRNAMTQKCQFTPCHQPTPPATIPTMQPIEQLYEDLDNFLRRLAARRPRPGTPPLPAEIISIRRLQRKTQITRNESRISQIRAWSGQNHPVLDLQIESTPNLRILKRAPRFPLVSDSYHRLSIANHTISRPLLTAQ